MKQPIPALHARPRAAIFAIAAAVLLLMRPSSASPGTPDDLSDVDLTELSLEELLNMEVTISRSTQKLSSVPGAVYVLTGDEIRRAGHTSIQEAMRMVPGFYVSNWTTATWDVTSRGFGPGTSPINLAFLNQLLVLVDGVVVYTPLFAGAWWPLQDVDMDDIDRIEIMRGPGGILWGSNAVHGVVHVITKKAGDTQGVRVSGRLQTDEWHGSGRFGGELGEDSHYRVYLRSSRYDTHDNPFMGFSQDWGIDTVGMRFDWGAQEERHNVVWGRAYSGDFDDIGYVGGLGYVGVEDDKEGFQVYGSTTSADGKGTLSSWISQDRQNLSTELDIDITSFDVEYKHDFQFSENRHMVAGVGYRLVKSDLEGDDPLFLAFDPEEQTQNVFRLFGVHTWTIPEWKTDFLLGAQLEHNDFTQFEIQPTARATWRPAEGFATWVAVTHSTRTPSLEEVSLSQTSILAGDSGFESETTNAYEIGVRKQLNEYAVADVALFYNDYDDLRFEDFGTGLINNEQEGEAYGVEVALDLKPSERWSLRSAYSLIAGKYESKIDGADDNADEYHPRNQVNLRSYFDLAEHWELDTAAYFVRGFGDDFDIANRWRLDARIGWNPSDELKLYVGAQQLNSSTESEFDQFDHLRRQFFVGLTWTPR